ncbi:hypothetical protein Patl1_14124 [Pistacia atlantica]|uniref:Uncharacterized protein n=1 Tax=Pistacia atlantica TaxID=434234 RepID=A0ACC1ASI2_9ROSI|nr:hypothetical protein Patl1_14124 [Pistacia atlantica]
MNSLSEIGSISLDIKILQEKSMDMGLKLKNRKVMESINNIICLLRSCDVISLEQLENLKVSIAMLVLATLWVFDFIVQKLYALRKPKTSIQILQQNVLLKYK